MSLTPIGHRILVKPDAQPDQSAAGLLLPQDHDHVPTSGTVVALGPGGDLVRYTARQDAIAECIAVAEQHGAQTAALNALTALIGTACTERDVAVGDRVVFPAECGLAMEQDGEAYVILNEDDVAVIVADEEEAAA